MLHYPSNTRNILTIDRPFIIVFFLRFCFDDVWVSLLCPCLLSLSLFCFWSIICAQHVSSLLGIFGGHFVTGTIPRGHFVADQYSVSFIHTQCAYFTSFSEMKKTKKTYINTLVHLEHYTTLYTFEWLVNYL